MPPKDPVKGALASGDITANPDGLPTVDGIPTDKLLGIMIGYTIQSCRIPIDVYEQEAIRLGLPPEYIPRRPDPQEAFKRATHVVEHTEYRKTEQGELRIEYKVDAPHKTTWYTISERIFGKKNESSDKFDNLVSQRVLFNTRLGSDGAIVIEPYDNVNEPVLMQACHDNIQNEHSQLCKHFTPEAIRRVIWKFVKDVGGISYTVANGGTFFLPIEALDLAQIWEDLIRWVSNGNYAVELKRYNGIGSRFIIKAVLDTAKERLYVMEDVQQELADRYRLWLKDLLQMAREKENADLVTDLVEKKIAQKKDLNIELLDDYKRLLGKEITYQLTPDILEDVRNFKLKDGSKPEGRLAGLFDELIKTGGM